jgi:hypothetical protein
VAARQSLCPCLRAFSKPISNDKRPSAKPGFDPWSTTVIAESYKNESSSGSFYRCGESPSGSCNLLKTKNLGSNRAVVHVDRWHDSPPTLMSFDRRWVVKKSNPASLTVKDSTGILPPL